MISIKWLVILTMLLFGGMAYAESMRAPLKTKQERAAAIVLPSEEEQINTVLTAQSKGRLINACVKIGNSDVDNIDNAYLAVEKFIPDRKT